MSGGGVPAAERFVAFRLSFYYATAFLVIGVHLPFWPVWLASRGLGATEIATVIAAGVSVKIVANPLIAHIADRRGERRRPMIALAALALVAFSFFQGAGGFWSILLVSVIFFAVWSAIMPLGESLTMLTAGTHKLEYGRVRLWGSLAFIAASSGAGHLLAGRPEDLIYWLVLGALGLTLAGCLFLPDTRPPSGGEARLPITRVLKNRAFLLLLAAAALIQGSHGVYYAFGTLHWRGAGYGDDVIGWLWAEGVIAEILLFAAGGALVRRLGPETLIVLGGLAGALRWGVTGISDALPVLVAVQALHAFTYGATHLGAIHFIARSVAPDLSATAQSLYAAVVMGGGLGLALLASGVLYEGFAGGAYLAMAVVAGAGALLAAGLTRQTA